MRQGERWFNVNDAIVTEISPPTEVSDAYVIILQEVEHTSVALQNYANANVTSKNVDQLMTLKRKIDSIEGNSGNSYNSKKNIKLDSKTEKKLLNSTRLTSQNDVLQNDILPNKIPNKSMDIQLLNARKRKHYELHASDIRKKRKIYYEKNRVEMCKKRKQNSKTTTYKLNRSQIREKQRVYYENNREKLCKKRKIDYQQKKLKFIAHKLNHKLNRNENKVNVNAASKIKAKYLKAACIRKEYFVNNLKQSTKKLISYQLFYVRKIIAAMKMFCETDAKMAATDLY